MTQNLNSTDLGFNQAYAVLREHGKTFYVMAKLFGKERGMALAAVYSFCRACDDVVDNNYDSCENINRKLDDLLSQLRTCAKGENSDPLFQALGETIRKYKIEMYPFEDLVTGVRMDLEKKRYENFQELDVYCYHVAGTVGLLLIPISGYRGGQRAIELAKILGKAFQLTNILRDVGADMCLGRVYLPSTELKDFHLEESDIISKTIDDRFRRFMDFQIQRAFAMYKEGLQIIPYIETWGGRISFQFAADAYSRIMIKIKKNEYDVFSKRAHLSFFEKIALIPLSVGKVILAVVGANLRSNQRKKMMNKDANSCQTLK